MDHHALCKNKKFLLILLSGQMAYDDQPNYYYFFLTKINYSSYMINMFIYKIDKIYM